LKDKKYVSKISIHWDRVKSCEIEDFVLMFWTDSLRQKNKV